MKNRITAGLYGLAIIAVMALTACSGQKTKEQTGKKQPLNITIYLDLSDRLVRPMTPSQKDRDMAIIQNVLDIFTQKCITEKILQTKNRIKVVFYPTPADASIAARADRLEIDLTSMEGKAKRKALKEGKQLFSDNLGNIYDETIREHNWTGSDVWDFFSDRKVDQLCIKNGYRNIFILLTDGYLYQADNKQQQGDAYNYILPQTLTIANSSLICKRKGLDNLEVLVMEINPYQPQHKDKMKAVLGQWLQQMGVQQFEIVETDLPSNTKPVIEDFLK